jgi:hypothetical protein
VVGKPPNRRQSGLRSVTASIAQSTAHKQIDSSLAPLSVRIQLHESGINAVLRQFITSAFDRVSLTKIYKTEVCLWIDYLAGKEEA